MLIAEEIKSEQYNPAGCFAKLSFASAWSASLGLKLMAATKDRARSRRFPDSRAVQHNEDGNTTRLLTLNTFKFVSKVQDVRSVNMIQHYFIPHKKTMEPFLGWVLLIALGEFVSGFTGRFLFVNGRLSL